MSLKTKVKAGRINNLSDARYCAGMGVEMMGFVIDPESDEALSPELFNAITGWISGVKLIGEIFSSNLPDNKSYSVSAIQTGNPELIYQIKKRNLPVILSIDIGQSPINEVEGLFRQFKDEVQFFLIEKSSANNLDDDEINYLKRWSSEYSIMLGFGVNADNLNSIMDLGLYGIAIYGSTEDRPGFKSYDEMADILEALEE